MLKDPIDVLKNTHKPIIGWLCCYTPLEIILAGGITPHRIIPEPALDMGDSYLHSNFCPYIRSSLGGAIAGDLDFMEGIVGALRRLLMSEIHVPEEPQIVGAVGAALSAWRFPLETEGENRRDPRRKIRESSQRTAA